MICANKAPVTAFAKIVAFGDSITFSRTGAAPGWTTDAGMWASDEDHDWLHLLAGALGAALFIPTAQAGSGGLVADGLAAASYASEAPDLVCVQAAEHFWESTPGLITTPDINSWMTAVCDFAASQSATLLLMGRWTPNQPPIQGSKVDDSNALLVSYAATYGGIYVDVGHCGWVSENRVGGDNWHPVDPGMHSLFTAAYEALAAAT